MHQTIIESERLRIRLFTIADSAFILQLLNTPSWIHMIGNRHVHSLNSAQLYIKRNILDSYKADGYGFYAVELKASHRLIGLCGITKRSNEAANPDLGFALLPEYQGAGYMFEAANMVLKYAKDDLFLRKIEAFTSVLNTSCQRLLEKLQFKFQEEQYEPIYQTAIRYYQQELL